MFEKILIPLDGTELSEGILPYVSQLARGLKAQVVLLSVIHPGTVDKQREGNIEDAGGLQEAPQTFEHLKAVAMARLEESAERLDNSGEVTTLCMVSVGEPAEEIVRVADGEGCGLIAMATHDRSSLWRAMRGSVADRVIRSANVPTLAVAQKKADGYWHEGANISKLLVALDGSRLADTVLPCVEHLARKLSLEIVLLQVMDSGKLHTLAAIEVYKKLAGEYLQGIAERLQAKGLTGRWQVLLHGRPATSIVNLAREAPGTIIVLASHGRSTPIRWIVGSVSDAMVRAPESPVLVMTPRAMSDDTASLEVWR